MARTVTGSATLTLNVADKSTDYVAFSGGNTSSGQLSATKQYGATAPTVAVQWGVAGLSLAGSATTLDLTALTGPRGTDTFASVRWLYIKNNATTAGHNLTVGNAASNAWTGPLGGTTPTVSVPPGGRIFLENPDTSAWTVDSTHKSLKLDPGANTFTVDIHIIGS